MLVQTSYCRDGADTDPTNLQRCAIKPQALFNVLLSRAPITDCVWQEHAFVTGLMSAGEVSLEVPK